MNKKVKILIIVYALLFVAIEAFTYVLLTRTYADSVIYGSVYTGNSVKPEEAIAIRGEDILFVGSKKDVKKYIGKRTKVLNKEGETILPGFTDTHTHMTPYMAVTEYEIDLTGASTIEEYKTIIKDFIEKHPDNEMYLGRGYDYLLFENGIPTKEFLDEIISDKPIYLKSADGHSCLVNSKMLELIEVTKDTVDPVGGKVIKDENGDPVGFFKDLAMDKYVKPYLKPYSVDQYKHLIELTQENYKSVGYTAYVEVFVEQDKINTNLYKAYEELDKENRLDLRVQGAWNIPNTEDAIDKLKDIIKLKNKSKGGMFELTDIKIFMDGVVESGTAYYSDAYSDDNTNYGADRWADDESFDRLVDLIVLANKNGMKVHFHAIGDNAVHKALDATEAAQKEYKDKKIHNVMTHVESVKEEDFKRFKELDIIVAANLSWGCKTESYDQIEITKLGKERADKAYPYKTLLDNGAILSSATDYPAGPTLTALSSYVVAVSRSIDQTEESIRNKDERMTPIEAVKAITYGGAYQMNQENIRGTLEKGKKADLIVLNRDPFQTFDEQLFYTDVIETMVNGYIVYKLK